MVSASPPSPFPGDPPITPELVRSHKLSADEHAAILARLGRPPTYAELGVLSVMWSEHCSYKSSRVHLARLPTKGPRVLQGPGENAGVVDLGDGFAAVFKMESHNHPSFIEPYQGAATGVGGILRDVFTMGARPVANLDSLRFGRPDHPRTPELLRGVVAGVGGYGNCMGVPTVGGELFFDRAYDGNVLVNAFTCGVVRTDRIFYGRASGVGNPVLYVGASTGRDGIHGATMASDEFSAGGPSQRPTVQVGDPFMEKLLLEACLEIFAEDLLVGIQDMGAAGLTSSSVEMAGRSGSGLDLDLDLVPRRARRLAPYEMLLSESQERMLLVAQPGKEARVLEICRKWELEAAIIGHVTDTGRWVIRATPGYDPLADEPAPRAPVVVCDLPVDFLTDAAPKYDRPQRADASLPARLAFDPGHDRRPPVVERRAPRPRRLAQPRLAPLGVAAVRSHRPRRHPRAPRERRRRGARALRARRRDDRQAPRLQLRLQRPPLRARPAPGRGDGRGGGVPQPGVRRRRADRAHRLPQLRLAGAPRDHAPALGRHRRAGGRLPRPRGAHRQRQRLALQRDRRPRDPADADHRRRRPGARRRRRGPRHLPRGGPRRAAPRRRPRRPAGRIRVRRLPHRRGEGPAPAPRSPARGAPPGAHAGAPALPPAPRPERARRLRRRARGGRSRSAAPPPTTPAR